MSYIKFKKTKIVATLGPGCSSKTMLQRLIKAGVNVFRINFSHATYDEADRHIDLIRSLNQELDTNVAILADLQGPKIRVGKMEDGVVFKKGDEFTLSTTKEIIGNKTKASLSYKDFPKDVKKGDRVLIDDGKLIFEVISTNKKDEVKLRNIQGGKLSSKKGVNLPNTKISTPTLTKKDKKDLMYAISKELDWIALSFVRNQSDLIKLKEIIEAKSNHRIPIIAKIEKPEAIENIDEIIKNCDGIMVARGDLGVETNPEDVPIHQRTMVAACRKFGKPCIVATQMLESMIDSPTPTRAEASDVATAVFQGVDAVMLSAESAAGNYPKESVEMMNKIIKRVESDPKYLANIQNYNLNMVKTSTEAIATAALEVATIAECNCIATFSQSGRSVLRVARMRPDVTLIGLTTNKKVARQNALTWGTFMDVVDQISSSTEMVDRACKIAKVRKILKHGEKIIITAGVPFGKVGNTNILRIAKIISNSKLT